MPAANRASARWGVALGVRERLKGRHRDKIGLHRITGINTTVHDEGAKTRCDPSEDGLFDDRRETHMVSTAPSRFFERKPKRDGTILFDLNSPATFLLKHQSSTINSGFNAEIAEEYA